MNTHPRLWLYAAILAVSLPARVSAAEVVGAEEADRVRVRAHFARVDRILRERDVSSLSVEVRAARARVLGQLQVYADRGVFPRNRTHPGVRHPSFIDADGRECAVAHLMMRAHRVEEASNIAGAQNEAYVSDMDAAQLLRWLAETGLSAEDAALIQPDYCFCSDESSPVCGADGITYLNECVAQNCAATAIEGCGECPGSPEIRSCGVECAGVDPEPFCSRNECTCEGLGGCAIASTADQGGALAVAFAALVVLGVRRSAVLRRQRR